jgi:hypothetical protein
MKTSTVIIITLSIASIPFGFYLLQFSDMPFSNNTTHWAEFGDYIGGLLNPILSAAAFILLLKTISQNEKALKQSLEEMELTRSQLEKSAIAQIEQVEIDQANLTDRRNQESLEKYLSYISTHFDELASYTELKRIIVSKKREVLSLDQIYQNDINCVSLPLYPTAVLSESLSRHLISILEKTKICIDFISQGLYLENHPDKSEIIQQTFLNKKPRLKGVISSIQGLRYDELETNGSFLYRQYTEFDPECEAKIESLLQYIYSMENPHNPYQPSDSI